MDPTTGVTGRLRRLPLWFALLVVAVLAVAAPNYRASRRFPPRPCLAQLRVTQTAFEAWERDQGRLSSRIDAPVVDALVAGGYLSSRPAPGCTYHIAPGDRSLFCERHGFAAPPVGTSGRTSPRAQLRARGCTDEVLLARMSGEPAYGPPPPDLVDRCLYGCLYASAVLALAMVVARLTR